MSGPSLNPGSYLGPHAAGAGTGVFMGGRWGEEQAYSWAANSLSDSRSLTPFRLHTPRANPHELTGLST